MAQAKRSKSALEERAPGARENKELQVSEDLRFQRRDWLAQRVGWGLMTLLLLAGLLGLAGGSGPFTRTMTGDGRGFTVEYDRFVRHASRTSLTFRAPPQVLEGRAARITIDRQYLAANDLQNLVPEPNDTRGRGSDVEFHYDVAPGEGLQVRWSVEPDELGTHTATVRLNDGPAIELEQFTYP